MCAERDYYIEPTDEHLAEALYIINKSAKKSRDTKVEAYYSGRHDVCHAAKTRSFNLYALKEQAIEKLVSEGKMTRVGIAKQRLDDGSISFLEYYTMGSYSFYVPYEGPSPTQREDLLSKEVVGIIPYEKDGKTSINYFQAKCLLENYVGMTATEAGEIKEAWMIYKEAIREQATLAAFCVKTNRDPSPFIVDDDYFWEAYNDALLA